MRDFGRTIRTLYATLLSSVSYDGQNVPLYTSEPYVTTPDNWMVLTAVDAGQANNDQQFVSEASVTLEIISRQNMANDRGIVDDIADAVLQALLPGTYADQQDSLFKVQIIYAEGGGYLQEKDGSLSIQRKIIRVFNRIIQK